MFPETYLSDRLALIWKQLWLDSSFFPAWKQVKSKPSPTHSTSTTCSTLKYGLRWIAIIAIMPDLWLQNSFLQTSTQPWIGSLLAHTLSWGTGSIVFPQRKEMERNAGGEVKRRWEERTVSESERRERTLWEFWMSALLLYCCQIPSWTWELLEQLRQLWEVFGCWDPSQLRAKKHLQQWWRDRLSFFILFYGYY